VDDELAAIDLACSRFREDSDLSRVNRAGGRPVSVSTLLIEALEAAVRACWLTQGAVDPTVGQALALAGYDRDYELLDSSRRAAGQVSHAARPSMRVAVTRAAGPEAITIDRDHGTVAVADGVRLDLGATAKALAADRAARAAHEAVACGVLVSLGGDIAVAGEPPPGGWCVRVCEDHAAGPDAPGQTVSIAAGGLATSSTTTRRWWTPDGERHHIIDPASGQPPSGVWRTASVAAGTCVDANTAATAAIVMGDRARGWLRHAGLPARLVADDGTIERVGDWPDGDLT
jgi:thiamine biosynthesis lipoprotein